MHSWQDLGPMLSRISYIKRYMKIDILKSTWAPNSSMDKLSSCGTMCLTSEWPWWQDRFPSDILDGSTEIRRCLKVEFNRCCTLLIALEQFAYSVLWLNWETSQSVYLLCIIEVWSISIDYFIGYISNRKIIWKKLEERYVLMKRTNSVHVLNSVNMLDQENLIIA